MRIEPSCFAAHMGDWLIEPLWMSRAVAQVKAGVAFAAQSRREADEPTYGVQPGGIAVIPIAGPMMKIDSKYGGTNTVRTRRAVRAAMADEDVRAVVFQIDSPGGTVAGTADLADDVRALAKAKPTVAYIEDQGASAAYWIASQARTIIANRTALVGSIGTLVVIHDMSKAAEMDGVTVHVVSTGDMKGAFTPGTPVTDEQLKYAQHLVDGLNAHFLSAVSKGRGVPIESIRKVADGRQYDTSEAIEHKLIDGVGGLDFAIDSARRMVRAEVAKAKVRQAKAMDRLHAKNSS